MVREDIVGGLRNALQKGETLQKAMMSFYSAGYEKGKVEEAARAIQMQQRGQPVQVSQYNVQTSKTIVPVKTLRQLNPQVTKPTQQVVQNQIPFSQNNVQKVSAYGEEDEVQKSVSAAMKELQKIQKSPTTEKITPSINQVSQPTNQFVKPVQPIVKNRVPIKRVQQSIQKVSTYGGNQTEEVLNKKTIIALVIILVVLLGVLLSLILLKEDIIGFFDKLFA